MILDSGFLLKTLWFYPLYLGISQFAIQLILIASVGEATLKL